MAKIIGNLKPEDDYTHALGPESNFNESMYFNFFDREQGIGGFVRIGNRANEGNAEMTVAVYLPDGRVLFTFKRPQIDDNDAFDAGGLRFEVIEPAQSLRTVYSGSLYELAEPRKLVDPRKAFGESPKREVSIDLVHDAVGPMYGSAGSREESDRPAEKQFGKAHYEQHMHVTGTIAIGDDRLSIDGYGLRDHSWGPRYWQAIQSYEWLTMNFGADFGAMVSCIQREEGEGRKGGVLVRGDEIDFVTEAEIDAEYEDNGLFHKSLEVRLKTAKGEALTVTGQVKGFIPLRNRRGGMTTHIGEGMTEWRVGDRVGYGLSEFLRQVT